MQFQYKFSKLLVKLFLLLSICMQVACKKAWLDAKPNKSLVVPTTIADYQAILDNNTGNSLFNFQQPGLNEVGTDDYYLDYNSWQSLDNIQERNAYIWAPEIFAGENAYDWQYAYTRILNANIVLDGIGNISAAPSNLSNRNNVQGTALFYRAYDFYSLAQEFAKSYDASSASGDLGIPLRTTADINVKSVRASVKETYEKIISDLVLSKKLLPDLALFPTRPGKSAVFGLLSRVYLSTENYDQAFLYADSCLNLNNHLLDFNTLSSTAFTPITRFNPEVIYHHMLAAYSALNNYMPYLNVDSTLYNSYATNDLRKKVFFKNSSGKITFNASYSGTNTFFGGLATDEIYLIRAECYARKNQVSSAMADLNKLLSQRWATGTFVPYTATNADEALLKILQERRKELVYRGLRWTDLKRLNRDSRFSKTLVHVLNGKTYTLPPNSDRYIYPIPQAEISLSGMQQNPR
ncbi:RagB/SusD family nutrient uptake outer membrane protein [Mucilaginibacter lappiensis]|uniref:SusD family protein n=1 Tax=Mucilaginibacter lappiensis TaxID=354630 RepID=A0A841JTX4_9SPHI|nr:RagB/SusD family nutrient uptake outer membrane protein [Mucilaginibacter lappiensis]MBB6131715.1 hypothetical protein [Mucilaginibacter lappiensis]